MIVWEGERLNPERTPSDIGMQNNDEIVIQVSQVGGSIISLY